MNTERNNHQKKTSAKNMIGFYIALSICIVAVALAAWSTYGGIMTGSGDDYEADLEANNQISGESYPIAAESSSNKEAENTSDNITAEKSTPPAESATVSEAPSADTAGSDEPTAPDSITASDTNSDNTADTTPAAAEVKVYSPIENGRTIKIFSPETPIENKTMSDWRTHSGIDLAAEKGTPVRAVSDGLVAEIYKDALLGNIICIDHNGYTAYYCGMTETPVVSEGNTVSAGDTIGYVGTIPCEGLDESHIHVEIKKNGVTVDPTSVF